MLNKRNSLIVILLTLIVITSCKKEYTTVGSKMIGEPHFTGKEYKESKVTVYDQRVERVYSKNNLPSLGYYKDPVFGNLRADFVTALNQDSRRLTKDLGEHTTILDAKLIIPYFSHKFNDNSTEIYELDSVYGNHPIDIKIYELTYLLPSYDPDTNLQTERYYMSDFDFGPFKGQQIADSIGFTASNEPYIEYKRETDGTFSVDDNGDKIEDEKLSPRMIIDMDTLFFRNKIFDHSGENVLTNASIFKDYFRGLYIEAQPHNGNGEFMLLDFNEAKVEINYTYRITDDNGTPNDPSDDTFETKFSTIKLSLSAPRVNIFDNDLSADFQTAIDNSDLINGDDKAWIKGDAGSEAVIQLFDNQQLRELREKDWLINQAELYIYVDETASNDILKQPKKLLLYDYDNKENLTDLSYPENTPDNGFQAYSGLLQEDDNGNKYYKFGITRHIRNVIKNDSTNVKLGLRVRTDIVENLKIRDIFRDPDAYNPTGIIIHGNQTTDTNKKPVLKIYYSDPE